MPNEELKEVREELKRVGAALGLSVRENDTAAGFARRCTAAARQLRLSAGITWPDYVLAKADKGVTTWELAELPESSPLGGPRWVLQAGESLEVLADKLGMYEDTT